MANNGEITMDDLAVMVKGGFDEMTNNFTKVNNRLGKVESRLDKVEYGLESVQKEMNKLKTSHEELKEIVTGVYRIEIIDLKKRVEILESKVLSK